LAAAPSCVASPTLKTTALGEHEITRIEETWEAVKGLPSETVGGLLFKHIFEKADVSSLFTFGSKPGFDNSPDAVASNPDVMAHGAAVVKTVSTAVAMLRDLEKLSPVLKDLGRRHAKYGVLTQHYPVVGAAFIKTLQVGLGDAFTPKVESAYMAMWSIVEATMLAGAKNN